LKQALKNNKYLLALATILIVLFLDQWLKVHVKTTMYYGQEIPVLGQWFSLSFVENPGMAFGWELPFLGKYTAKVVLSTFRIVAVVVIAIYLKGLIKKGISNGLVISIALVFSGALGNILDSVFYGMLFTESIHDMHTISHLVPWGEGYAPFITADVVDMLSFDLFTVDLPFYGRFNFFAPVFNLADFSISLGVGLILAFYRKSFQANFFEKEQMA